LPPYYKGLDHEINLKPNAKPLWGLIYNLLKEELKVLKDYLEKMLCLKIIRRSTSPIIAPLLFVGKKDAILRLYMDYRGLNAVTILNRYLIPLIFKILNRLEKAKIFIKINLYNIYHLIKIKEGHKYLTAF
jgi:hypothetical protein